MELLRPAVLLCPPLDGVPETAGADLDWRVPAHAALAAAGVTVLAPGMAHEAPGGHVRAAGGEDARLALAGWVADLAVAVNVAGLREPLLLVAGGGAARGLPALGFSQRAARHAVVGYVLVDAAPPPPSRSGQDWPDAPVVALHSSGAPDAATNASAPTQSAAEQHAREARLRGWPVLQGDPATTLLSLALAWPELPRS